MSDVKTLQSDGIPLNIKDQTARNIIATPYDPTSGTYGAGDVCINGNQGYKALVDISTPEAFDPTKWEPTTLGELYTELKSNLTNNVTFDYYEKSGTTDNRGLLLITGLPYNYIPLYVENFSLVTMFFNGSGSAYSPYVQIKNYDNTYYTNQYVTLKIRCMVVAGLEPPK